LSKKREKAFTFSKWKTRINKKRQKGKHYEPWVAYETLPYLVAEENMNCRGNRESDYSDAEENVLNLE